VHTANDTRGLFNYTRYRCFQLDWTNVKCPEEYQWKCACREAFCIWQAFALTHCNIQISRLLLLKMDVIIMTLTLTVSSIHRQHQ